MVWNAGRLPPEISGLDIFVSTRPDRDTEFLVRELQRTRSRVQHAWPMPELLPQEFDLLVCELIAGLPARLPGVPGAPKAGLVVLIPVSPPPDLGLLKNCAADAVLHHPLTTHAILVSLLQARTHFAYQQRLRWRIDKLDETLRSIRAVERAKAILVSTRNLDEEAAYHFIRRRAMERRVSVSAVAAAIVDSHGVLS
ncbi:MAG: ANTAR domain-containing response regulator [Acetobacteraceae bacterium]